MVGSTDLGEEGGLPAADHHRIRLEDPQDLVLLVVILVEQAHDLLALCRGLPAIFVYRRLLIHLLEYPILPSVTFFPSITKKLGCNLVPRA